MTSAERLQYLHLNEICGIATYVAPASHYPIKNAGRRHSGLLYTLEGEEIYSFADKTVRATPDSVLYIPRGEQYTIELCGERSVVIYFDFEAEGTEQIRPFLVNVGAHSGLKALFADSEHEWRRRRAESFSACMSFFYRMLSVMIRHEDRYCNSASYEKISDAVQYLHAHYADAEIKIKELAQHSGMSVRYFEMLFASRFKMTPKEYVLHLKIELAKELLQNEKNTVTDVAAQLGFVDIYHFSRTFKRKTGYTPTQYKQMND